MKKILCKISLVMTFVVMSLLFVSCNDDYPDDGYFKVNETSYTVNEALLKSVGLEGDYHQLRLTLNNTNTNDAHSLNFLLYSEVDEYLPSATYTPYLYDDNYHNKFKRGVWELNGVEAGAILLGSVKVTKSNDIYTIHINCKDVNNNDIAGYYKGEIKVIE